MKKIWKYKIHVKEEEKTFDMPYGSVILHVGSQFQNQVTLWVQFSEDMGHKSTRTFRIFGTGHSIPDNYIYVGTADDKPFMWHVYEELRNNETSYHYREITDQAVA
jgi:hypothetical protein